VLVEASGVRPRRGRGLQGRCLSLAEREEIALARAAGDSMRSIADRLRRSGSTISRELQRNVDGQGRYRATAAHAQAYGRAVPAGRLADRLGPRGPVKVMVAGTALFALAYALFAVGSTNWLLLTVPFLAAGAAIGCVETAEQPRSPPSPPPHYAAPLSARPKPRQLRRQRHHRTPLDRHLTHRRIHLHHRMDVLAVFGIGINSRPRTPIQHT